MVPDPALESVNKHAEEDKDYQEVVDAIKIQYPNITVLAGGQAFKDEDAIKAVNADIHLTTYQSIKDLK